MCQTKTSFGETPWLTGRLATPLVIYFLVSPCYLQDAMPCQCSSSNLPRVLQIWKGIFTLRCFLPYTPSCWFQGFPGAGSSTTKLAGLHADLRNSPGLAISLNHSNPQRGYGGWFYLRLAVGWLRNEESACYVISTYCDTWACQKAHALFVRPQNHTVRDKLKLWCLSYNLCFRSS